MDKPKKPGNRFDYLITLGAALIVFGPPTAVFFGLLHLVEASQTLSSVHPRLTSLIAFCIAFPSGVAAFWLLFLLFVRLRTQSMPAHDAVLIGPRTQKGCVSFFAVAFLVIVGPVFCTRVVGVPGEWPLPIFYGFGFLCLSLVAHTYISMRQARRYEKKWGAYRERRASAMRVLAESLGIRYTEHVADPKDSLAPAKWTAEAKDKDGGGLAWCPEFTIWAETSGYACNVLSGEHAGHQVLVFDWHDFSSVTTSGEKRYESNPIDFTVVALVQEREFPPLTIYPETVWDAIGKRTGGIDIDLESFAFSEKYRVWARDKRFAFDICQGRLMEYLLQHPELSFRIEKNAMALRFPGYAELEELETTLRDIVKIREMIPRFLYDPRCGET